MKIMDLDDAIRRLRRLKPDATVDFEHDEVYVDGPPDHAIAADLRHELESCGFSYDSDLGRWRARA